MSNSTSYLYDCNPSVFIQMPYIDALKFKIKQAEQLLHRLFEPHHTLRDHTRIQKVRKAIAFNEKLIREVKETL